jgi:large subunit ribosomal protein L11
MEIKHQLNIYIQSQTADAGPPLSTVLGNLGLNTIKFCKDFNEETKDLPNYFILSVHINIFENRNYEFFIKGFPLGPIISYLRYERIIKVQGKAVTEQCIKLSNVVQLSLFRFPGLPLQKSLPVLLGLVKSCGLLVIKE